MFLLLYSFQDIILNICVKVSISSCHHHFNLRMYRCAVSTFWLWTEVSKRGENEAWLGQFIMWKTVPMGPCAARAAGTLFYEQGLWKVTSAVSVWHLTCQQQTAQSVCREILFTLYRYPDFFDSDMTVAWIRILPCFYPNLLESTLTQWHHPFYPSQHKKSTTPGLPQLFHSGPSSKAARTEGSI